MACSSSEEIHGNSHRSMPRSECTCLVHARLLNMASTVSAHAWSTWCRAAEHGVYSRMDWAHRLKGTRMQHIRGSHVEFSGTGNYSLTCRCRHMQVPSHAAAVTCSCRHTNVQAPERYTHIFVPTMALPEYRWDICATSKCDISLSLSPSQPWHSSTASSG
jgi:hypothetical protein